MLWNSLPSELWLEIVERATSIPYLMDVEPPKQFDPALPDPFDLDVHELTGALRKRAAIASVNRKFLALSSTVAAPLECLIVTNKNAHDVRQILEESGRGAEVRHLVLSLSPTILNTCTTPALLVTQRQELQLTVDLAAIASALSGLRILTISVAAGTTVSPTPIFRALLNTAVSGRNYGIQRVALLGYPVDSMAAIGFGRTAPIISLPGLRSLTVSRRASESCRPFTTVFLPNITPSLSFLSLDCQGGLIEVPSEDDPAILPALRRAHFRIFSVTFSAGWPFLRHPRVTELALSIDSPNIAGAVSRIITTGYPRLHHLALRCDVRMARDILMGELPPSVTRLSLDVLVPGEMVVDALPRILSLADVLSCADLGHRCLWTVEIANPLYFDRIRAAVAGHHKLAA